jgi:hypothetical protein
VRAKSCILARRIEGLEAKSLKFSASGEKLVSERRCREVNLFVESPFERHDRGRRKVPPTPYEGKVAKQIVKHWSHVVINRQPLLDELLTFPLSVFKSLGYPIDMDSTHRECDGRHQSRQQFDDFKTGPVTGFHAMPLWPEPCLLPHVAAL